MLYGGWDCFILIFSLLTVIVSDNSGTSSEHWTYHIGLLGFCLNPLNDTFSIPSGYLFFSGYFDSAIRGKTFLPTFCHFAGQINYPFDFISWRNLLVEFYGNGRPVDVILRQAQSQSSRYLIWVILRQTHFLQVPLARNITPHTLKGLNLEYHLFASNWNTTTI